MTESASNRPRTPWVTIITAAVIGIASLILGLLDMQISQANPWWAIGAPLLLLALAAIIRISSGRASQ